MANTVAPPVHPQFTVHSISCRDNNFHVRVPPSDPDHLCTTCDSLISAKVSALALPTLEAFKLAIGQIPHEIFKLPAICDEIFALLRGDTANPLSPTVLYRGISCLDESGPWASHPELIQAMGGYRAFSLIPQIRGRDMGVFLRDFSLKEKLLPTLETLFPLLKSPSLFFRLIEPCREERLWVALRDKKTKKVCASAIWYKPNSSKRFAYCPIFGEVLSVNNLFESPTFWMEFGQIFHKTHPLIEIPTYDQFAPQVPMSDIASITLSECVVM